LAEAHGPIRFGVVWQGAAHEVFNVVADTRKPRDESIYLHTYSPAAELGVQQLPLSKPRRFHEDITVSSIETVPFRAHKLTFHSSGLVHWTDKTGARLPQHDGRRTLSFGEVVDCWTLFSIYPMTPDSYQKILIDPGSAQPTDVVEHGVAGEEVIQRESHHPIQLVDIAKLGFVPLQITFYLVKSDFDFSPIAARLHARYRSLFLRIRDILPTYRLDGMARFHKSSNESFPRDEAILTFSVEGPSKD
jgi:hypothetical protein